jgi:polyhydroxybutyrate depolymerase
LQQGSGTKLESMQSGGIERTYRLHVPSGYDASRPTPLVLNFHGFASNAWDQEAYTRMTGQADKSGFVTVAPDGSGEPRRWYIYGRLEPSFVDDYAFTRELIDQLSAQLCIDPARIYATGMSNGGGMSSLLGCELNDPIAAIAPAAGSPYSMPACRGKAPMPIVAFHGTDDRTVPFEGGVAGRLGLAAAGVRENMRRWAEHNGCTMTLKSQRIAFDVLLESYEGCRDGADVRLYVVEGGGHTWPGADDAEFLGHTTHSIDATAIAWQFFAEHPKK